MRPHTLPTCVVWRRESEKLKERNLTRKVDMHALITYLNQKPILECYVVRCGSKTIHQKTCVYKSLDHIVNTNGGTYMTI